MKLSRFDFIDKLNAWTFEQEITCVNGDKKTVTVIAMEDVNQALDELMNEGDIIHIVSKSALDKPKKKFKHNHKVCGCGRPYSQKDLEDGMCNKCYAPTM